MKAIQLGIAVAFVAGVLLFLMKGGVSGNITDEIM